MAKKKIPSYNKYEKIVKKAGLSNYKVSGGSGVGQSTLSDWKLGKSTPTDETLEKLAKFLGVEVDDLKKNA